MHVAAPRPCVASSPWLWRHCVPSLPPLLRRRPSCSPTAGPSRRQNALLGMDVRPGGEAVLLVGEDGWAHRIDGLQPDRRDLDVALGTGRSVDINAVDWHPGGATALWSVTQDC